MTADHFGGELKFYGKYSGYVEDNDDKDKLGRLQIRVPSVFGAELVVQARPCLPSGHFFVPPKKATIWVEFEAGDPQYPIWVGVYYQADSVPKAAAVSPPVSSVISTPAGHTIELTDDKGKEKIVVTHKGGAVISIDEKGVILLKHSDSCSVELSDSAATVKANKIVLQASAVEVGQGAAEPTLKGTTFAAIWKAFSLHTHPTVMGPSGPPTPPGMPLDGAMTTAVKVS